MELETTSETACILNMGQWTHLCCNELGTGTDLYNITRHRVSTLRSVATPHHLSCSKYITLRMSPLLPPMCCCTSWSKLQTVVPSVRRGLVSLCWSMLNLPQMIHLIFFHIFFLSLCLQFLCTIIRVNAALGCVCFHVLGNNFMWWYY
jgi:hypothetical protein